MRPFLLVLLCLAAANAGAQPSGSAPPPFPESVPPPPLVSAPEDPSAPPEPAAAPPEPRTAPSEASTSPRPELPGTSSLPPPPLPGYTGPALTPGERAQRYVQPERYSSYSAGPGGLALIGTELVHGAVAGGLLGAARDRDGGVASGIMLGALSLGTTAAIYQYFARVERNEGWLTAISATAGLITGLGVGSEQGLSRGGRALLTLATTQLSVLTTLAFTAMQPGDVSGGDTWLMGTASLYAFIFTGLVQGARGDSHITPTFLAPTLGLIGGALLTMPLEPSPGSMFAIAAVPLAAGMGTARLLESLNAATLYKVLLITMGSTFLLTMVATTLMGSPEPQELSRGSGLQAIPIPVVLAAGRDNDSLAAGPGLLMRF